MRELAYTKKLHDDYRNMADYHKNILEDDFWDDSTVEVDAILAFLNEIERLQSDFARLTQELEQRKWIPVSERLPEEGQSVLLYDRVVSGCELAVLESDKRWHIRRWYLGDYTTSLENVKNIFTHWMPLPPPPNREEE